MLTLGANSSEQQLVRASWEDFDNRRLRHVWDWGSVLIIEIDPSKVARNIVAIIGSCNASLIPA
jgi:hypothetical protein